MAARLLRFAMLATFPALLGLLSLANVAAGQTNQKVVIASGLEPAFLQIEPGTTVAWRNDDDERRRMRSRDGPVEFDSGNLEPGESFSFTFAVEGLYPYLDHRNDEDAAYYGTIVVAGASDVLGPLPVSADVSIANRSFQPGVIQAAIGATITWTNDDGEAHTVTASDDDFDSGILGGSAAFSQSFDTTGTFTYFCAIHPEMRGIVTIREGAATDPTTAPDPTLEAVTPPEVPGVSDVPASSEVPTSVVDASTPGVSIIDLGFQPADVQVSAGSSVEWRNDDSVGHTVTASEGAFGSGVLTVADRFAFTFEEAGTFDYFCAIHPQMTGRVTVLATESG